MRVFRRVAAVVVVTSLAVLGGCGSDEAGSGEPVPEWLFSLQATGMTTYDPATRQLIMPVGPILAFTDRPDRVSRVEDPLFFAQLWSDDGGDSFAADPPNIVLTWWPTDGGYLDSTLDSTQVAVIAGDVNYDSATSSLSMTLGDDGSDPLNLPAAMDRVSVFVDGISAIRLCESADQCDDAG